MTGEKHLFGTWIPIISTDAVVYTQVSELANLENNIRERSVARDGLPVARCV